MTRLGCIVLIVVLLIVGYDQWRIEQLRNEVESISQKVHVGEDEDVKADAKPSDLVTSLAEVERHTQRAKKLLDEKDYKEAAAELDKALQSLESANDVSEDIMGDVAESLGQARDKAIRVFRKAWNDIAEEAQSGRE